MHRRALAALIGCLRSGLGPLLLLALGAPIAASVAPDAAASRFFVGVDVVDVVDGRLLADQTVEIRGGRIVALAPREALAVPADAVVLARGGVLVPGLRDMHVHSLGDPDYAIDRALPLYLAHGVTGIRDMGSGVDGIVETRARLAASGAVAPDLIASGPLLDGVALPWYGDLPLVLESPEAVPAALDALRTAGIDFFKVYDQLSAEVHAAVVAWADEAGMAVAGHPPRAVGLGAAAAAGQRTIEHLSVFSLGDCVAEPDRWFERALGARFGPEGRDGYHAVVLEFFAAIDEDACEATLDELVHAGTYFTPTLVMEMGDRSRIDAEALEYMEPRARQWCETTLAGYDGSDPQRRDAVYDEFRAFALHLHARGIPLLAGSDNANFCLVPGSSLHLELERLVEAGLTPLDALRAATLNAARALGRDAAEGRIAPGYRADLLLLRGDPRADIRELRALDGVLVAGRWLDRQALDGLLRNARSE